MKEKILNSFKELYNIYITNSKKEDKLDFKTWLYLFITNAKKTEHALVRQVDNKKSIYLKDIKKNEIYIFKDYNEYKQYYLMYLDNVDDNLIDLAIYTRGKKGQIIALKGLCEHIIIKTKIIKFYSSITQEKIDEIHAKKKLTPLEAVQMWESLDICAPASKYILDKNRCEYFECNCHDCLIEYASHNLEYDIFDKEQKKLTKEKNIFK